MKPKRHRTKQLKHIISNELFDYYISKTGYVVRYSRVTGHKNIFEGHVVGSTGYVRVSILEKSYFMHRLVALAFIPNPNDLPTVDHINGDKSNNHVSNLRWLSYSDNTKATPKCLHKSNCNPKRIKINDIEFSSLGEGSKYIISFGRGKFNTVRKELRKFIQGKRPSWKMYGKFKIEKL